MKKTVFMAILFLILSSCSSTQESIELGHRANPEKTGPGTLTIKSTVYQIVDRQHKVNKGYGLYSYLVLRGPTEKSVLVLEEFFKTTINSDEREIKIENLNAIIIPVTDAVQVQKAIKHARTMPNATAKAIAYKFYDYGYAEWLYSAVCQIENTETVKKACGNLTDRGPYLFTTTKPIINESPTNQKLLVVSFTDTHLGAIPEVIAAYKRQISRQDFTDRKALDTWRLDALNILLSSADLVPLVKKAFAGEF